MKSKDVKRKKFHFHGEEPDGSITLTECTDQDHGAVVRLERTKSGEPLKLGAELCQMKFDAGGHVELDLVYTSSDGSGVGPPKVSTKEYREGWDRIFGSDKAN